MELGRKNRAESKESSPVGDCGGLNWGKSLPRDRSVGLLRAGLGAHLTGLERRIIDLGGCRGGTIGLMARN